MNKSPEAFAIIMEHRTEEARIKLDELRGIIQCPPHQFAWRMDGKAECVKCGKVQG